ncbi:MAG: SsrA-binding protein SmpB [Verrucomicrobia bacterium]|nr:SsrA-binding protein SmpB [Verrucomicrobiota bacterium]
MGSPAQTKETAGVLTSNRKARHDYHILQRIEAGIALRGTEVKALRAGHASLTGAYALAEENGLWLKHLSIPAYEHGNRFNHEPERPRRLLLHANEIRRLAQAVEQQGQALIPLSIYLKKGLIKVELGVCRGKTHGDRRETIKARTTEREVRRAIASRK